VTQDLEMGQGTRWKKEDAVILVKISSDFILNPSNLGPMLGSQALPVTSQDKLGSDRGVTPL
jgi:hypothetical protein